jgi:hypothetical protein
MGLTCNMRDSNPPDQDGYWFPPDPYGVSTPFGYSSGRPATATEVTEAAPLLAFAPLQRCVTEQPRTVAHHATDREVGR